MKQKESHTFRDSFFSIPLAWMRSLILEILMGTSLPGGVELITSSIARVTFSACGRGMGAT